MAKLLQSPLDGALDHEALTSFPLSHFVAAPTFTHLSTLSCQAFLVEDAIAAKDLVTS